MSSGLPNSERLSSFAVWIYAIVAVAAILYLPYFVPLQPSSSLSWLFGYNNRAAVVLIFVFAAVGAIWTGGRFLQLQPSGHVERLPRSYLWLSMAFVSGICLYLYHRNGWLPSFSESPYNLHRVWLVTIGERPYVDFEWPFGVAQLYVPAWFHRVFSMTVKQATYLYWGSAAVAGAAFLYGVVNRLDYPSQRKKFVFLMILFTTWGGLQHMAAQYTLLRYTAPLYAVLLMFDLGRKAKTSEAWVRLTAIVWAINVGLFLISPEAAVAFTFTSMVLLFPRKLEGWPRPSKLQYAALIAGLLAICAMASRLHEMDTARSDSGGAEAFPVILSIYTLLVLFEIAIGSSAAYKLWTGRQPLDNSLAVLVMSIALLPAAFGRADPGHMQLNLIGLLIVVLLYVCKKARGWWYLPAAYFVFFFVFGMADAVLAHARNFWLHKPAAASTSSEPVSAEPVDTEPRPPVPVHIDFAAVYPGVDFQRGDGVLEAPFGYTPEVTGLDYESTQVDYGYYRGNENADSLEAIGRRVAELQAHGDRLLLIPKNAAKCHDFNADAFRASLEAGSKTVYWAKPMHLEDPMGELCGYIQTHYVMTVPARNRNWNTELWVPRR